MSRESAAYRVRGDSVGRLLSPEARAFIEARGNEDPREVALSGRRFPRLPMAFVARQIEGRRRARRKLPTWAERAETAFPQRLALEQCSSEEAARYKAGLVGGSRLADLTGGFGVDAAAFAARFERVDYVERSEELAEVAAWNFRVLGLAGRVTAYCGDGLAWLGAASGGRPDWVYLDPSRRERGSGRPVSALGACEPDPAAHLGLLRERSRSGALIKLSPGFDIEAARARFGEALDEIHVVAVENACKELLLRLKWERAPEEAPVVCVDLGRGGRGEAFRYLASEERGSPPALADVAACSHLYEPRADLMKAGPYKLLARRWGVGALGPGTRLFASQGLVADFPGRRFAIEGAAPLRAEAARALFPEGRANAVARNLGMRADQMLAKLGLADGGEVYAVGARVQGGRRRVFRCRLVSPP